MTSNTTFPSTSDHMAWTTEETGVLFSDLRDFFMEEDEENYFLGSTVLIKQDGERRAEVIDGQQRLTTLTILLATIASKLSGVQRDNCVIRISLRAISSCILRNNQGSFFDNATSPSSPSTSRA